MIISNRRRSAIFPVLLTSGLLAIGCGDDDKGSVGRSDAGVTLDATVVAVVDATVGLTGGDAGSLDGLHEVLSDSQIAGVLAALNQGEIDQGNYALTKARDQATKDYAQMMVTMHTAAQAAQASLLQTLGLTAAESALSRLLTTEASAELQQLKSTKDSDFDETYVLGQARQHRAALNVIIDSLLPQADAPALKTELQSVRATVTAHLDQANALLGVRADAGVAEIIGLDAGL
ncbi:MAG: hypothetical protein JWN48_3549 [Myxococcaceae bacterium]|nr:hypothetical protein [Myxococcaceae bacterium]